MGYGDEQLRDLEVDHQCLVTAKPWSLARPSILSRVININKPNTRVFYDLQCIGEPSLETVIEDFFDQKKVLLRN